VQRHLGFSGPEAKVEDVDKLKPRVSILTIKNRSPTTTVGGARNRSQPPLQTTNHLGGGIVVIAVTKTDRIVLDGGDGDCPFRGDSGVFDRDCNLFEVKLNNLLFEIEVTRVRRQRHVGPVDG
ncbi:MAG: hypothetical protein ACK56F_09970, partial [bacterium]